MRAAATLGCLLFATSGGLAADLGSIKAFYEATCSTSDPAMKDRFPTLAAMGDEIKALTADEVKVLLPLAQRCWLSKQPTLRDVGMTLLLPITLRPDSASLMEPYVDEIGALLSSDVSKGAVYILGAMQPTSSPKAVGYLIKHLTDKAISADELRMTAAAILDSVRGYPTYAPAPDGAERIHRALDAVDQRPELKIKGAVIEMLAHYQITNEESLQYIRSGLIGEDRSFCESSIDAVDHLRGGARDWFAGDLQRIASDPRETPVVRSRAASVLAGR